MSNRMSAAKATLLKAGLCAVLTVLCLVVYGQVLGHDFVNYDDNIYVTDCPQVQAGLTWTGFVWAFTNDRAKYFQPLAWLSHMLDSQIYGPRAWGHHLTNLLFHAANAILLFLILTRMTSNPWPSFAAAALFAVHPLHVESVAWVAERKDVLSLFFWLLATGAYARYVERPGILRYGAVALLFVLGLMAKPMLVTFPCVLLLLDYWPLGRYRPLGSPSTSSAGFHAAARRFGTLVLEKLPLFACTAAISVVTYVMQARGGNLGYGAGVPLAARLANAIVAYAVYLLKGVLPLGLAPYYPHPFAMRPLWQIGIALVLLGGLSTVAALSWRRRPYLIVGWLWYLGTLAPVIQILQAGMFAYADRYTYIPLIGIYLMVAWTFADWVSSGTAGLRPPPRVRAGFAIATGCTAVAALAVAGALQTAHWKDTTALFTHALHVTKENPLVHNSLGLECARRGETDNAIQHYNAAIRLNPDFHLAHNNLGLVLASLGRNEEAVSEYQEVLKRDSQSYVAYNNLGVALYALGKKDEAMDAYHKALQITLEYWRTYNNIGLVFLDERNFGKAAAQFREAIRFNPNSKNAYNNLGLALLEQGKREEAAACFSRAGEIDSTYTLALATLGKVLIDEGNYEEGIKHSLRALQTDPGNADLHFNIGIALFKLGRADEAVQHFSETLRLSPDDAKAHAQLGTTLLRQDKLDEAMASFTESLRLDPNQLEAHNNLGNLLARQGKYAEANEHYQKALENDPQNPQALNNTGCVLREQGRHAEAIAYLEKALQADPNYAGAHFNLGDSLAVLGRLDEASVHLKRTIEINPNNTDAREELQQIEAYRARRKQPS